MNDIILNDMSFDDFNFISDKLRLEFDEFWSEQNLKSEFENLNSKCIVAKYNNEPVGFVCIWKGFEEYHITNIVTRKDFRKRGIGTVLLNRTICFCKEQGKNTSIILEVNEKNLSAQKLYEKFNFQIIGIRKKYYNNIDDAIIMKLEVN